MPMHMHLHKAVIICYCALYQYAVRDIVRHVLRPQLAGSYERMKLGCVLLNYEKLHKRAVTQNSAYF